jgi:hypothetical protein
MLRHLGGIRNATMIDIRKETAGVALPRGLVYSGVKEGSEGVGAKKVQVNRRRT